MKNKLLFNTMREIFESHATAGAMPNNLSKLGARVQMSRGDPTYRLTVSVAFHHIAGDDWWILCELYSPSGKHSDKFFFTALGKARHFWDKLESHREEFEGLARSYLREAA